MLARESTLRERQLDHQLTDLRARVATIGGTVDREIPENAVSAFKRKRVQLPDSTYGFRVVRPEWEKILTALRRGECNALMVPDIDRATRDPRTLTSRRLRSHSTANSTRVNANTITWSVLSALPSSARLRISRPGRSFSPTLDGSSTRFLIPSAQPSAYISSN